MNEAVAFSIGKFVTQPGKNYRGRSSPETGAWIAAVSKQAMIIDVLASHTKTSSFEAYYIKFVWFAFRNVSHLAYNPPVSRNEREVTSGTRKT